MENIKVLIADDNFVARRGLRSYFREQEDIVVVGEASNGSEAVEFVRNKNVDIVLMDLRMPNKNGIEATAEIVKIKPEVKVLVLTVVGDKMILIRSLMAGAKGCLVYGRFTPEELLENIYRLASGKDSIESPMAPDVLSQIKDNIDRSHSIREASNIEPLSDREVEILSLIAIGKSNKEIADILNIKEKTVKNYISNIYSKLQIKSRYEAISYLLNVPCDGNG
ncbi:MAG: response regulator transcription factor [Dehalococcoidales bacterium]|jgi:DNA-binding NarL/FixJ family response regulator|nr:response regulator transcription factor [Dehalococcoidales bacterium]